ncbi:uncharacterized protein LOC128175156 [Crassostrea angulata]|uniref:uncharacterized protein LOC128175156 n=1 Tax=Magallana angulata TaxID=2784310 RepID=UPI0022B094D4|nr:uncharacterized protein LOC128175156 [Crassostrea angulata]
MQSTIESLKEQIQDLKESHRESSGLRCRMCDHLQRLNEAYTNKIREKDRRIADLENQLFECTKNLSLEKTWTSSNNTPHKPRRQQKASLNTSLRSESPDSRSRNTPNKPNTVNKEAVTATIDNRSIESSLGESTKVNSEEKGPKLRLRTRKRNRYTEDPSPENKRQKIHSKDYTEEESSQLLVPETCDPDIIAVDHEESPGEEEGHHLIPDTEAGVEGTTSDSESDPDETVPPGSVEICPEPVSVGVPLNGSIDPVVQLSVLCDDSQSLKSYSKDYTEEESSQLLVPETCDPDIIAVDHEESPGEEEGHHLIPDTEAGVEGTTSDSESDPDETVPPGSVEICPEPVSVGVPLNGSIDPVVQLSVLCDDSQSLKSYSKDYTEEESSQLLVPETCDPDIIAVDHEESPGEEEGHHLIPDTEAGVEGTTSDSESDPDETVPPGSVEICPEPVSVGVPLNGSIDPVVQLSVLCDDSQSLKSYSKDYTEEESSQLLVPETCDPDIIAVDHEESPGEEEGHHLIPDTEAGVEGTTSDSESDPDETVPPGSVEICPEPVSVGVPLNGSIDPVVQLSVLCDDSQSLKSYSKDYTEEESSQLLVPETCDPDIIAVDHEESPGEEEGHHLIPDTEAGVEGTTSDSESDPDETVPPGSVEICPEPVSVGVPLNGSIDPVVQLSVLCDDSQSLKSYSKDYTEEESSQLLVPETCDPDIIAVDHEESPGEEEGHHLIPDTEAGVEGTTSDSESDPDETVPPGSVEICPEPVSVGVPLNGSIDPVVQLSVLCDDSQSLKSYSKDYTEEESSQLLVPETCDPDIIAVDHEESPGEEEGHHLIPDTEAGVEGTTSDSESDPDETVPPGSVEICPEPVSVGVPLNGSIDPVVQLSVLCDDSQSLKSYSKDYTEEESSQLLVPETCDPDIIAVDHEESPGEEEGHHLIPDTEAGVEGTTSDSESDPGHEGTGNRYSLRSSLFSPSSEESDTILKSPRRKAADKKTGQCHSEEVKKKTSEKDSNSDKKLPLVEGCDGYIQSSPICQVYKKSNLESPDVNKTDAGVESDAESPLLLKINKNLDEKGAKEGSPAKSRLFAEDCESIVSPVANSSLSKFRSLSQGSRQRGRLNQSKLSCSEERKRKSENGESWLNSTKPAVKDSPTLRQSTPSQVFMNVPTKPQPEKSTESDDIQEAIELSLRDQEKSSCEYADVDVAQKDNLSLFKRHITPMKCIKSAGNVLSFKKRKRKNRQTPIDCDPDETVPPGSVEICPEPASVGVPLNGSIDPVVQLSVLCDDSQSLKSDDLPDIEPYTEEDGAWNVESYTEIDRAENSSQIGNLTDFRIEDLRKAPNPLTSTYIDVENPPHGVEDGSLSVPCSAVLSSGKRKIIRIPDNSEDSNSESLMPNHDDSFDRVPGKEQPNFAHVDVVRKQDERRRLPAHKCGECREYFEGMGLSEEEIQKRLQTCSRHRAKHAAPGTPEHFWDIGMEDTLECEERGYVNTKDPDEGKPRFRRKRQLNKMFKSKKEEEG